MNTVKNTILVIFLLAFASGLKAQDDSKPENKILYRKEMSGFLEVHTGGWGLGYRSGRHITGYRKWMWEVEGISMKHPKEYKIQSIYESSRSFIYGKLNSVFFVRGGYGRQKILNGKPYWGGVEVRWFWFGGASIAFAKPVYLYIAYFDEETSMYYFETERFNPDIHSIDNIYGRASFFKGFNKMKIYPGIYLKTGLSFEYGADQRFLKSIECGLAADGYLMPIPMMAHNRNQSIFLSLYLSIHIGKRKN